MVQKRYLPFREFSAAVRRQDNQPVVLKALNFAARNKLSSSYRSVAASVILLEKARELPKDHTLEATRYRQTGLRKLLDHVQSVRKDQDSREEPDKELLLEIALYSLAKVKPKELKIASKGYHADLSREVNNELQWWVENGYEREAASVVIGLRELNPAVSEFKTISFGSDLLGCSRLSNLRNPLRLAL